MSDNNILPFRPAVTGQEGANQIALWNATHDIKFSLQNVTESQLPRTKSKVAITLALMIMRKEVSTKLFIDDLKLTRLPAYIHSLRKRGFFWIVSEPVVNHEYFDWEFDEFKRSGFNDKSCGHRDLYHRYWLPEYILKSLPDEFHDWANEVVARWIVEPDRRIDWPDFSAQI